MAKVKKMRVRLKAYDHVNLDMSAAKIVEAAKALGVYTIVTSWNKLEDAPAKQIADEYWDISLTDYDALLKEIKAKGVDGMLTGFTDSYLLPYQHLCELANLPCYATKEVFETTMDKGKFKKLCQKNDIPFIPEYQMESFDPIIINKNNKVIIKPVDNSGSRGVILCETMAQAGGAALRYSGVVPADGLFFFATLDKVKFRNQVRPGDKVRMEIEFLRTSPKMIKQAGKAYVGDTLCAEAEWMCLVGSAQ